MELTGLFADALTRSNRSLESEGAVIASVLNDEVWGVDIARPADAPTPSLDRRPDKPAELTEHERVQLCREFLETPPRPITHQVVWVCFERARCHRPNWIVRVGPVTFIDGPTLQPVLDAIATNSEVPSHLGDRLPSEVLHPDGILAHRLDVTRDTERLEEWVWARVEVDGTHRATAVKRARRIATSLVDLAAFHDQGTRWKLMTGGVLLDAGRARHGPPTVPQPDQSEYSPRWTSETLGTISEVIGQASLSEKLLGLLATADAVRVNGIGEPSPSGLLIDVQVIEVLASQSGGRRWQVHMTNMFALAWAQEEVLRELINAQIAADSLELRQLPEVIAVSDLYETVVGSYATRVRLRYDLALERLPALAAALPVHAPGARRLRTLANRLAAVPAAVAWVDDLIQQFEGGVERLARCRNAGAHGGPIDSGVVASVREFANGEARRSISLGVWATAQGEKIEVSHQRVRDKAAKWRSRLTEADTLKTLVELEVV
ncbi:hypothetical protein [Oerskovia paurometabola]|uniref:hypothetical protein n=1 Tax=Oerskovia paurometabola TaxID=162170 RepID=UPI0037F161E5